MLRLLTIVTLLFLCGEAFAQGVYFPRVPTVYGIHQRRDKVDSARHIPEKTSLRTSTNDTTAQIFYLKSDSSVYGYSKARGYWVLGGGGGSGTDNAAYHTVTQFSDSTGYTINRPNGTVDSIIFVGGSSGSGDILSSGFFTPVVDSAINGNYAYQGDFMYSRVNNVVTISGRFGFVITVSTSNFTFSFKPPIASTFSTQSDAAGTAVALLGINTNMNYGIVYAVSGTPSSVTNNDIQIQVGPTGTGGGRVGTFTCQYIIR